MKKTLLILLTLSLILSLFSCTKPPETTPISEETDTSELKYTDESEFGFILTYLSEVLYKIYPEEGAMIPACIDPLCNHKSLSCPLSKMNEAEIVGELLCYSRKSSDVKTDPVNKICTYNLFTGEYKVIYETEKNGDSITYLHVTDEYLFFNLFNSNVASTNERRFRLVRYDPETKESVILTEDASDVIQVLSTEKGRIYWYDGLEYYSTDFDYKNKKGDDRGFHRNTCTAGYGLSFDKTGEFLKTKNISGTSYPEYRITRTNLKTREESVLIESTGTLGVPYNGKLIYTRPEPAVFIGKAINDITGKETRLYDKYGSKIYICNIDGSEDRFLCDISGNNCVLFLMSRAIGGKYGVGDYVTWHLWYYEPVKGKPDVLQRGDDRVLVVNIVTGEYKILSAE